MITSEQIIQQTRGGLIVSCQPVSAGPMDRIDHVVAMALAAVAGGAMGLRIEGSDRVRAVAATCDIPIVGIVKRDLGDSNVRISPLVEDIEALAQAGARIVAFDATDRPRPVPAMQLLATVHAAGCFAMADCATFDEAATMAAQGCDFVATTLSGYTGGDIPAEPDLDLVRRLSGAGYRVVAEGRYNTPALASAAIAAGAHAVTVGSAITRIEHIVEWFGTEMGIVDRGLAK